ncbi:MAG: septation protein SepH, partial [Nocardioides sp.]
MSDDGKRLLLVSDKGVEFTLDIDARLRAALRGDHARLGHLEIKMDSALRPRDIQARIRAGDTPEAVAQAAQTTVDRIMAFAAPVLA